MNQFKQSVVKDLSTLVGEASMTTDSNSVTVSATLTAAVVYHRQAIELDAAANSEMHAQEAEKHHYFHSSLKTALVFHAMIFSLLSMHAD